jgi:hypothetical protein
MKRPAGVTVLAVLALVGGTIQLVSSLGFFGVSLFQMPAWMGVFAGVSSAAMLSAGVFSLAIAIAAIAFGVGALQLRSWAWLTGMVVYGIELVAGIVQLLSTGVAVYPILMVVLSVAIVAYLASATVREAFGVEMSGGHYTSSHHHPTAA